MKCPLCNTEMSIGKASYVENGGSFFRKLPYICRNKNCSNFSKVVTIKYTPLQTTHDSEAPVVDTPAGEETE